MSSISVRFNSFLFFYSIFNERNLADIVGWSVWMDSNHRAHTTLALLLIQARICVPSLFDRFLRFRLVGLDGLEPSTSRLSGARSNHLSYKPLLCVDSFPSFRPCCSLLGTFVSLPSGMNFKVSFERPRVADAGLPAGRSGWIRTIDLALIRRAL